MKGVSTKKSRGRIGDQNLDAESRIQNQVRQVDVFPHNKVIEYN